MNYLMTRRRMMEDEWWDYTVLKNSSGTMIPIAIPVVAGDIIMIKWENATKSMIYRIWALEDGATFVDVDATNQTSYYFPENGTMKYTVATDGTLILGGLYRSPQSLWGAYALRAHFLGMRFL